MKIVAISDTHSEHSRHTHESYGNGHIDNTHDYNVSICDGNYRPTNEVTVIKGITRRTS